MCQLILLEKIEKVQKYKVTLPLDLLLCYLIRIGHRLFTILEIFVILQFRSNYFIHWVYYTCGTVFIPFHEEAIKKEKVD